MIEGFSKWSYEEKLLYIASRVPGFPDVEKFLKSFRYGDNHIQVVLDEIIENSITNYVLPYSVAPNFLINGKEYLVPMVTEESSVVAAAASAAKFWARNGGFTAEVASEMKTGQIHFLWNGKPEALMPFKERLDSFLRQAVKELTVNMERRGGGIRDMEIFRNPSIRENYYQLLVHFGTGDAMGANFINSVLEKMASVLVVFFTEVLPGKNEPEVIMSILSNYTNESMVEVRAECPLENLAPAASGMDPGRFAERFVLAVNIAREDVYRAVTHNKGIMNGIDAVVLATGNDFRAVEAGIHAWAARNGKYQSLSVATIDRGRFTLDLKIPLAIGTVGGLTSLHPLAAFSMELLGKPSARELMQIVASTGLASHFSAVKALITTGIQKGHMKMHLSNMLHQLQASEKERKAAREYFRDRRVTYAELRDFIEHLRNAR